MAGRPATQMGECSVDGCNLPAICKGYCNPHYRRSLKGMDMSVPVRPLLNQKKSMGVCSVNGCWRDARTLGGLCQTHERRQRGGEPLDMPVRERARGTLCAIEGCNRGTHGGEYCANHYARIKRERNWEKIIEIKGNRCSRCGGEFHWSVFDMHHRDPSVKDFNIGGKLHSYTWERIEQELEKCDLLCANCHRLTHYEQVRIS